MPEKDFCVHAHIFPKRAIMRLLDISLLVLLAWGCYRGFRKGLMLELFSAVAWVLAILGSTRMLDLVLALCSRWFCLGSSVWQLYVVFMVLFVSILLATRYVGKLLKALIQPTHLGSFDRLLGGTVGILKWGIYTSSCLWIASWWQLRISEAYTTGTFIFPVIESLTPQLIAWLATWWPDVLEWLPNKDHCKLFHL